MLPCGQPQRCCDKWMKPDGARLSKRPSLGEAPGLAVSSRRAWCHAVKTGGYRVTVTVPVPPPTTSAPHLLEKYPESHVPRGQSLRCQSCAEPQLGKWADCSTGSGGNKRRTPEPALLRKKVSLEPHRAPPEGPPLRPGTQPPPQPPGPFNGAAEGAAGGGGGAQCAELSVTSRRPEAAASVGGGGRPVGAGRPEAVLAAGWDPRGAAAHLACSAPIPGGGGGTMPFDFRSWRPVPLLVLLLCSGSGGFLGGGEETRLGTCGQDFAERARPGLALAFCSHHSEPFVGSGRRLVHAVLG
uniref:Uncharacterized protein n=1 Tax=Rangifer tarandus platyrhynchus TaxID=3082113 RepID=A0ACB0E4N2_RANTA|nr:unnamed protein product [Rangifer tarandus platyrhynchus]